MTEKKPRKISQKKEKVLTENDLLKFEIAEELGLMNKVNKSGWKSLTAKESGKIGGLMTKRNREKQNEKKGINNE